MTKLEIGKSALKVAASIGVGAIVGNAVGATTPSDVRGIRKLIVGLGSLILANIASDKAAEYCDTKVDQVVDETKKAIAELESETEED